MFKAGFLVTARGGSGIVIAKLDDDNIDYATGKYDFGKCQLNRTLTIYFATDNVS